MGSVSIAPTRGRAGELEEPELGGTEREGAGGGEARVVAGAGVGIKAGRHVECDEQGIVRAGAHAPDGLEDPPEGRVEVGARADAEDRVEHQVGQGDVALQLPVVDVLGCLDDADAALAALGEPVPAAPRGRQVEGDDRSPVGEVARGHHAVAAVVARTDENHGALAPNPVEEAGDAARDGESGALHQGVLGAPGRDGALLQPPHLLGGDHLHADRPTTEATAWLREWARLTASRSMPILRARATARPCSAISG